MIRNLLVIAGASFVLMLGCAAGVVALAGPVIMKEGWTVPFDDDDVTIRRTHVDISGAKPVPQVSRKLAWTGETLAIDLPVDVTYVQGPIAGIEVNGPKAYVDRLRVENGRLSLAGEVEDDHNLHGEALTIDRYGLRIQSNAERMKIVVTAPKVSQFQLNGSGDLEIQNYDQPTLTLAINGSGDINAAGRTTGLFLTGSGSGDAELDDLRAMDADIALAGSGNAEVDASNKVKIAISGSGDVSLRSQPTSETSNISGSGSVRHND
ncbi:GIN domain-containing protein [Caulobacter sp.]|uniref:GIN domain-containing protein n=1 Tax=Caulobacter sp. TaxID=78 RepID=UPI003BACBE91